MQARADAIGAAAVVRVDMPWEDRTLPLRGPGGQSVGQAGQFCLEVSAGQAPPIEVVHGPRTTTDHPLKRRIFLLAAGQTPEARDLSRGADISSDNEIAHLPA